MFKNMGGNIPGGNFPDGNFPGGSFPDTLFSHMFMIKFIMLSTIKCQNAFYILPFGRKVFYFLFGDMG